jgi:hypothetical protein
VTVAIVLDDGDADLILTALAGWRDEYATNDEVFRATGIIHAIRQERMKRPPKGPTS